MTKEKMTEFKLSVKDHVCDYRSVSDYLSLYTKKQIFGDMQQMVMQDYFAQIMIRRNEKIDRIIVAPTVADVMAVFKKIMPEDYATIPEFDADAFQKIADSNKASSALSYWHFPDTEKGNALMEGMVDWLGDELESDDYVGDYVDPAAFLATVREKRVLTEIHCYPRTPVGFYNYYGIDFQSVIDECLKP